METVLNVKLRCLKVKTLYIFFLYLQIQAHADPCQCRVCSFLQVRHKRFIYQGQPGILIYFTVSTVNAEIVRTGSTVVEHVPHAERLGPCLSLLHVILLCVCVVSLSLLTFLSVFSCNCQKPPKIKDC